MKDMQEMGAEISLVLANSKLNIARNKTPKQFHSEFQANIRYNNGLYVWSWQLR